MHRRVTDTAIADGVLLPLEVLEGDWKPSRLVMIEFPSMQHIRDWVASPGYAPLLALRQPAAVDCLVAVEGC